MKEKHREGDERYAKIDEREVSENRVINSSFSFSPHVAGILFAIAGTAFLWFLGKGQVRGFTLGIIGFVLFYPLGRLVDYVVRRAMEDTDCIDLKIIGLITSLASFAFPIVIGPLGFIISAYYLAKRRVKFGALLLFFTGMSSLAGWYFSEI